MWKELKTIGGVIFVVVVIFGIIGILSFASKAEAAEPVKKAQKSFAQKAKGKPAPKTVKKGVVKLKASKTAVQRGDKGAVQAEQQKADVVSPQKTLPVVAASLPGRAIERFTSTPCREDVCMDMILDSPIGMFKVGDSIFPDQARALSKKYKVEKYARNHPEWEAKNSQYVFGKLKPLPPPSAPKPPKKAKAASAAFILINGGDPRSAREYRFEVL